MRIQETATYGHLREEANHIPSISTNDHLPPERMMLGHKRSIFDILLNFVTSVDLVSAGMGKVGGLQGIIGPLADPDWDAIWLRARPWLDHVRQCATFQTRMRGIRSLHGFDEELDDSNWRALNEKVMAAQKPGWLYEVLHTRGNVIASHNDNQITHTWADTAPEDRFYSCNVVRPFFWTDLHQEHRKKGGERGKPMESLQDAIADLEAWFDSMIKGGVIGLKMHHAYWRTLDFDNVPRAVAEKDFPCLDQNGTAPKTVQDFMADEVCRIAAERKLPVAFHTGYQLGNNNEIRNARAQLLAPLIQRHPNTQFDIFHVSYPYSEEAMLLAKYFPNVVFNFCFTEFLSPHKFVELMHIALDLLPSNKIFGWGADTVDPESHHGSLCVTRDCIARCLSERVEDGILSRPHALQIMRKLMHDNPAEVYRLEEWRAAHPIGEPRA